MLAKVCGYKSSPVKEVPAESGNFPWYMTDGIAVLACTGEHPWTLWEGILGKGL